MSRTIDTDIYITKQGIARHLDAIAEGREIAVTHMVVDSDLLPSNQNPANIESVNPAHEPFTAYVEREGNILKMFSDIPIGVGGFQLNGIAFLLDDGTVFAYARGFGDYKAETDPLRIKFEFTSLNTDGIANTYDSSALYVTHEELKEHIQTHLDHADPHPQYLLEAHAAVESDIDNKVSSRLKYINLSMLWRALAKNLSEAKAYTVTKYNQAKGYTDTKHGEALTAVNEAKDAALSYTRSKVAQAKAEAKSYTDTKHGEAINHTNVEKGNIITTLKSWANGLFFLKSGGDLSGDIHIKKGSNESGEVVISEANAEYGGGMQYHGQDNFLQFLTWSKGAARQWFMRVARGSKNINFAGELYAQVTKRVYHDSYHPRADVASNAEKLNDKTYTQIIGEAKSFTTEQHEAQKVYFEDKHNDAIAYTDNKLVEAKQYADSKHNTQQAYINSEVGKAKRFAQGLHDTQQEYVNQQIAAVIGANVPSDLNSIKELIEEIQNNQTAIELMRNIQAKKLDKDATAANSIKFNGKTYAQARADFRSGLITSQRPVSDSVTSNSSTVAASSKGLRTVYLKAVEAFDLAKAARDIANDKWSYVTATTSRYGATKLSSAINSTSEVLAATPKAVKKAFDKATEAYELAQSIGEGNVTKELGDGWWLGKNAKAASAASSDKLQGKTKAQVVTEARSGLALAKHFKSGYSSTENASDAQYKGSRVGADTAIGIERATYKMSGCGSMAFISGHIQITNFSQRGNHDDGVVIVVLKAAIAEVMREAGITGFNSAYGAGTVQWYTNADYGGEDLSPQVLTVTSNNNETITLSSPQLDARDENNKHATIKSGRIYFTIPVHTPAYA
ncbi:hypothetical protein VCHA29O37_460027 [Vibrio chagasii]|nr:hypothetical protein VCHA29O37_460027 [Vibrio chagasii]